MNIITTLSENIFSFLSRFELILFVLKLSNNTITNSFFRSGSFSADNLTDRDQIFVYSFTEAVQNKEKVKSAHQLGN